MELYTEKRQGKQQEPVQGSTLDMGSGAVMVDGGPPSKIRSPRSVVKAFA